MAKAKKHASVNDGIDAAFEELDEAGIVAAQNVGGTMSDGWAVVNGMAEERDERPRGAVFYHRQDRDRALAGQGLWLAFGAYEDDDAKHDAASLEIGREVVAVLNKHGVETVWDGTIDQRIQIPPFKWKKRGDKFASIDVRMNAAEAGQLDVIRETPAAQLDARDQFGRTMLSIAASNDYPDMVAWLLDAGAKPDAHAIEALFLRYLPEPNPGLATPGTNHTLLHIAAWSGCVQVTKLLLERGFDLEARDPYGATPLLTAAMHKLETVELLLEAGADVNAHDVMGRTALDHADDPAIAKRLLEAGVKPDGGGNLEPLFRPERGHSFDSPIERFAAAQNAELVALLLAKGAKPGRMLPRAIPAIASNGRWEELDRLLAQKHSKEALDEALVVAAMQESAGIPVLEKIRKAGATDVSGALSSALVRPTESREVLEWLLGLGATSAPSRWVQGTALGVAFAMGNGWMVDRLLAKGADLEARDEHGNTALILAVKGAREPMVRMLLERGANARTPDRNGRLPIVIAMESTKPGTPERRAIMDLLAKHGGKPDDGSPKAPEAPAAPKTGDTVEHATFGKGRVLAVRDDKLEVEFETAGRKVMLARLLKVV